MDHSSFEYKALFSNNPYYQYVFEMPPPPKPQLKPKEAPNLVEPLSLEPSNGPKNQLYKLAFYQPDEVIFEESETDEKTRATDHILYQKALKEHNIRIRSQSENLVFSVLKFLQQKKSKQK